MVDIPKPEYEVFTPSHTHHKLYQLNALCHTINTLREILNNKAHTAKYSKMMPSFLVISRKKLRAAPFNEKHIPVLPSFICQQMQILHMQFITDRKESDIQATVRFSYVNLSNAFVLFVSFCSPIALLLTFEMLPKNAHSSKHL